MASKLHLKRNQFYELKNKAVLNKILKHIQGSVFEIGAGNGALTKLLQNPVVSEIDRYHFPELSKYTDKIYGDFTKIPTTELQLYDTFVGNLPYSKFKKIFNHLEKIPAKRVILLIQQQVGLKIIQQQLSRVKIMIENRYFVTSLGVVSKYNFKPVPSVNGILLLFELRDNMLYSLTNLKQVVQIFSYGRKTLGKIYKLLNWSITLYKQKRPSTLTQEQFTNILKCYLPTKNLYK